MKRGGGVGFLHLSSHQRTLRQPKTLESATAENRGTPLSNEKERWRGPNPKPDKHSHHHLSDVLRICLSVINFEYRGRVWVSLPYEIIEFCNVTYRDLCVPSLHLSFHASPGAQGILSQIFCLGQDVPVGAT